MDYNYLLSLLSFSIGLLAGFQGIHDRYKKDSYKAAITRWGLSYLFIRGGVPLGLFFFLYGIDLFSWKPLTYALVCGIGAEAFLRSKFFIKQEAKDGISVDVLRGGLDLLNWYQTYFLENVAERLAASKIKFLKSVLPERKSFLEICDLILINKDAFDSPKTRDDIEIVVNKFREEFSKRSKGPNAQTIDSTYQHKMA
jgi:hypothetical protein